MSFRQCVRALCRVNSIVLRPQSQQLDILRGLVPTNVKTGSTSQVKDVINSYKFGEIAKTSRVVEIPALRNYQEIIDPLSKLKYDIGIPIKHDKNDVSLPQSIVKEIADPKQDLEEKKAARLIVIRRAKMKKHKWRKLQKKMKFVYARRRQQRELKKEKAYQAMLLAKIKEAEKFEVEEYVVSRLRTARWEKPITRVRGFFAPDWVIRDHLRAQEEKRVLEKRIAECLQFKKQ